MFLRKIFWNDEAEKVTSMPVQAITPHIPTLTFSERLTRIQYDEDKIPDYFVCPISYAIMDEPVMVNGLQSHTFDRKHLMSAMVEKRRSAAQYNITTPIADPYNTPINIIKDKNNICVYDIKDNLDRSQQIESFVSCLEKINHYQNCIEKLGHSHVKKSSEKTALSLELSLEETNAFINTQLSSAIDSVKKIKANLLQELQTFVILTELVIKAEDKQKEQEQQELLKINGDKLELIRQLHKELSAKKYRIPTFFTPLNLDANYSPQEDISESEEAKPRNYTHE